MYISYHNKGNLGSKVTNWFKGQRCLTYLQDEDENFKNYD